MSQPSPSSPQKTRIRWFWALIIAVCMTPVVLVAVLAGMYMVARQQQQEALVQVQAHQIALLQARQLDEAARAATLRSTTTPPVVPSIPRKQAQLVRIQLDFEDFETRTAEALTVDSTQPSGSRLMVPSEVFAPMTGKINGRMVTRTASNIRIIDVVSEAIPGVGMGGMAMPPAGGSGPAPMGSYSGISVVREHASIGLTELTWPNATLTPVRVLGDFPKATVGDKLTVVSASLHTPAPALTVLGTDETAQNASGIRFEHLLKLTGWVGPVGAMVCNEAGDPVGQILFTVPGKLTYTYAIPMDRIFAAIHDEAPRSGIRETSDSFALERLREPLPSLDHRATIAEQLGRFDAATGLQDPRTVTTDGPSLNLRPAEAIEREPLPTSVVGSDPQSPAQVPPPGTPSLTVEASQAAARTIPGEMRVYRVQGFAPDVADTVRSLYGTEAKVAVDRGSRAVIAIASPAVQDKISATIEEMNRGAQEVMAEQAKKAELEKKQQADLTAEQRLELERLSKETADREAAEDESHRKNPKRTRIVKVDGRDPQEVSKILSNLFGQKADIAIDERTGSVLITVNRATTWAEVQFLLSEIEATAKRLATETPAAVTTPILTEVVPSNPLTTLTTGGDTRSREQVIADQDREAKSLALQLRTAAPAEQGAVRKKLEQQIERQFRERQSLRKQEIDDLSGRIEKLRSGQIRREENRTEIIRRRINELLDPQSDLRWDESQNSTRTTTPVADQLVVNETAPDATPTATTESTFDGVPYSQWRRMLETERKPAKLTTAMEACSRLASPVEARQVARAIIKAAAFEADTSDERQEVWKAALNGLERMPADAVIDEVLASLNMTDSTSGRNLQGIFFAETERSATMSKALNAREQEIVAALINAISQGKEDREWLLAGACRLWENSSRELKDFVGLEPLVLQRIDTPPPVSNYYFGENWMIVAEALVKKNPETPGLAVKFMNYSLQKRAFSDMTRLVGDLGRLAEPAVPMIVERFLKEWKEIDDRIAAARTAGRPTRPETGMFHYQSPAERLIELLGKIGTGTKAASLLTELNLIAIRTSGIDVEVFDELEEATGKFSRLSVEDGPPLLPDGSLINGAWKLQSLNFKTPPDAEVWIRPDRVAWRQFEDGKEIHVQSLEGHFVGRRLDLDVTKTPKLIVLREDRRGDDSSTENKRLGTYELTEATLKIYLAPIGKPQPEGVIKDPAAIPEGYTLIELRRSLSIPGTAESPE